MDNENKVKPTYVDFDYDNYKWKSNIDYRKNPHLYKIGRGQQLSLIHISEPTRRS